MNFTLEMEAGTGKKYTFIKTMYELNKVYGFKKIVVVPSVAMLYDSGKLNELRSFAQSDALLILVMAAAGVQYYMVNDKLNMSVFDGAADTYLSSLYPQGCGGVNVKLSTTIYQAQALVGNEPIGDAFNCVLSDSAPENQFARDCAMEDVVKLFFKLPSKFKIPTPLGNYNPDWALVFENDKRVHFVVETKSSSLDVHLRLSELLKIKCGEKHFDLGNDVVYKKARTLEYVVSTNKDLT